MKGKCYWTPLLVVPLIFIPTLRAEELIERVSSNTSFWYNKRDTRAGMYEVKENVESDAKVDAMNHEIRRLQSMVEKLEAKSKSCMALALYSNICDGPHDLKSSLWRGGM